MLKKDVCGRVRAEEVNFSILPAFNARHKRCFSE